jgi:glycosyltransferase involved in cell wall biosynthesis
VTSPSAPSAAPYVVIPAHNEREALPGVIHEVRTAQPGAEIVVVDDGSTDGTAGLARRHGADHVIVLPYNSGVGAALRAGLLYARRRGARAVVQCDADGQHPANAIAELVAGLGAADIVIGARFTPGTRYRARGPRALAMRLLAAIMSRLHRTKLTDATSGFRAFGPRAIAVLSRELPAQYLGDTIEALTIAKRARLAVRQVPVQMRERQGGQASSGPFQSALYLVRSGAIVCLSILRLVGARLARRHGRGRGAGWTGEEAAE